MFSKANKGRVWWPVLIPVFSPDTGEEDTQRLMLLFEPLTRKEKLKRRQDLVKAAQESIAKVEPAAPVEGVEETPQQIAERTTLDVLRTIEENFLAKESDIALVLERTHDWRAKDGDEDIPFERSYLADLMEQDHVARHVLAAFNECNEGHIAKNSEPGRAGKPAPARG